MEVGIKITTGYVGGHLCREECNRRRRGREGAGPVCLKPPFSLSLGTRGTRAFLSVCMYKQKLDEKNSVDASNHKMTDMTNCMNNIETRSDCDCECRRQGTNHKAATGTKTRRS